MATVADVSQLLGDYMLRGWVLTDQSCPTAGCTVPLLRSPKGRTPITTFCVKCSGGDSQLAQSKSTPLAVSSAASSESHISRSSTPPTEISDVPSSPMFVPMEETPEAMRRRQQSDQASSEIGKRLLKGWAMLGDECPNDSCYGVPLVRPPKKGGEKDPRKDCVICGNSYVTEIDWAGRENLVPFVAKAGVHNNDRQPQASTSQKHSETSPIQNNMPFSSPFGRHSEEEKVHISPHISPLLALSPVQRPSASQTVGDIPVLSPHSVSLDGITLDETSRALHASLQVLSGRLTTISSNPIMDTISLGATADAIHKVAQALGQVRNLQRDQS